MHPKGASSRRTAMRKRKYTEERDSRAEFFTEDIDMFIEHPQTDMPMAEIHNLVGTCKIKSSVMPLDLCHVSRLLHNAHFDKQKFAAITIRLHDPVCTVLLFTSGKLVLTGTKTFLECIYACMLVLKILRRGTPESPSTSSSPTFKSHGPQRLLHLPEEHVPRSDFCVVY